MNSFRSVDQRHSLLTYRVGVPGGPLGSYCLLPLIIHISVTAVVGCSGEQYGFAPQPSRPSGTYNLLRFLGNGSPVFWARCWVAFSSGGAECPRVAWARGGCQMACGLLGHIASPPNAFNDMFNVSTFRESLKLIWGSESCGRPRGCVTSLVKVLHS